jgi:hypothetical protein
MRLILRRYGLPIAFTLGVYTLLYFFCGAGVKNTDGTDIPYCNAGFWIAVLYAVLMRFTDDILDYEKDKAANKAPIKKNILYVGGGVATAAIVTLVAVFSLLWLLLPIVWIGLLFVVKGGDREIIKPFFTPAVVLTLAASVFCLNAFAWILAAVLILADSVLILQRRK